MVHRLLQGEVLDLEGVQESRLVHRLLQREVLEGVQKVQDLQELQEVRQIRRLLETNQLGAPLRRGVGWKLKLSCMTTRKMVNLTTSIVAQNKTLFINFVVVYFIQCFPLS